MTTMTIGKAAMQAGVSAETIRFYERQGLIEQPSRPARSVRRYSGEVVREIRFIKEAQQLGFSLREAGELLDLRADPAADCADVRSRAVAKRDEVREKIERLEQIGSALDALIDQCPGCGDLHRCSIIESLDHAQPESRSVSTRVPRQAARTAIGLQLAGMRCGACAAHVQVLILDQPGICSVTVSHERGRADLIVDSAHFEQEKLCDMLSQQGYPLAESGGEG